MLMPPILDRFPRMLDCRQQLFSKPLDHAAIPALVQSECARAGLDRIIKPGMTVAIAAGSRGIDAYALVVGSLVRHLQDLGAQPFIFPAMGSHGGATADGQLEVLESLGITEQTMRCPINSSMDVVELGRINSGLKVYLDRFAARADAIIPVNRVKEHTNFRGTWESGLCKMLAIGAGKHAQAIAIHGHGVTGLRDFMPSVARMVIEKSPVVAGLALVEDARHQLSRIECIPAANIFQREAELMREVRTTAARLPVEDLDLLIVERMGKNISGLGMDTNITGRCGLLDLPGFDSPRIRTVAALDLTDESHGNAIGVGLCDLIPRRLADKIDIRATAINGITAIGPQQATIPITLDTDRDVIRTALDYFCAHKPFDAITVIRIRDTLSLAQFQVSTSLAPVLRDRPGIELTGTGSEMTFDSNGNLC